MSRLSGIAPISGSTITNVMPKTVTVINDSHASGWTWSIWHAGELYMSSVADMVLKVEQHVGNGKIARLNLLDHSYESDAHDLPLLQFGAQRINLGCVASIRPLLSRLTPLFAEDGFVHLQHCYIGTNSRLLVEMANAFGVPVYAGTGAHLPAIGVNLGEYVRADPDGTFHRSVGRP